MGAVGDDLDPLRDQAVDDPHHRLLVAGDGARGENYAVAGRERDVGMLVLGNARERGARLALAAGAKRHHLVRGQMAVNIDRTKILHAFEIAGLACDLHDAIHGAADHDHLAPTGGCRLGHGAQARDVRGKRGDRNPSGRRADQFAETLRHVGFGW